MHIVLLTENEDGPDSSSSLIESIDEYWACTVVSDGIVTSTVESSSSSVHSLQVATLKP